MKTKKVIEAAHELSKPYRVTNGKKFRLKDVDPGDTGELKSEDKPRAKEALQTGVEALAELQDMLYAQDRWSVLLIFQAMDAAGKDGTIKHVMSGVNPQGCQVSSFKAPSSEDLDHDYLWRCMKELPERGRIGIFNRSYYEETLVGARASGVSRGAEAAEGMRDQRHLGRALPGHPRFRALPAPQWHDRPEVFPSCLEETSRRSAFSSGSICRRRIGSSRPTTRRSAAFWDDYMKAYEETIRETATKDSPWYVVPADNKWFTRVIVAAAVIDALARSICITRKSAPAKKKELAEARKLLHRE